MRKAHSGTWMSGLLVLAAALLVSGAAFVLFIPDQDEPDGVVRNEPTIAPSLTPLPSATPFPTQSPAPTATITPTSPTTQLPTAAPELIETSVAVAIDNDGNAGSVERNADAFTINENRVRTQVIQYEVQSGDNIYDIAARYGLELETLIWSNGSFYVNALRPGLKLNIMPVDGAIHKVEDPVTIAELATEYEVEAQVIINSEFNNLQDAVPESILPVGLEVVIEGGTGKREPIYWNPGTGTGTTVNASRSGSSGGSIYQGTARFGVGQPGSCGVQEIYDGTMPAVGPVGGYVTVQDFTWSHSGIDLSAAEGTPVKAVGGGTVIFVGWSDWGYGYSIVIAHGPVMTLYAHLNGPGFVWCGKQVVAGEHIANVGSTGHSSGPHLHFEVRNASGVPQNPRDYLGFSPCSSEWCISD